MEDNEFIITEQDMECFDWCGRIFCDISYDKKDFVDEMLQQWLRNPFDKRETYGEFKKKLIGRDIRGQSWTI
jgi:hypothetical protein